MDSTGQSRRSGWVLRLTLVLAILLAGFLVIRQVATGPGPGRTPVLGYIGDSLTVDQGEAAIATDLSSLGFSGRP